MEEALASIDTPLPVPSRPPQPSSTILSPLSPPQAPQHSGNEFESFGPRTPTPPNSHQFNQKGKVIGGGVVHVLSPPGTSQNIMSSTHSKPVSILSPNGGGSVRSPEGHRQKMDLSTLDTSSLHLDATTSGGGIGSPYHTLASNHPSQPVVPVSPTFKQQIEEHEKLIKDNFNLRLKLYYMDEKLRNMCENGNEGQEAVVHELIDTRAILEEREKDVEHRDRLLSQAQSAIEGLSEEVEYLKARRDGGVTGFPQREETEADAIQLQARLAESQHQLEMVRSEVERLIKTEESSKLLTSQKEEEIPRPLGKASQLTTKNSPPQNAEQHSNNDVGVTQVKRLQQKLEEYQNELNRSNLERDRARVELGKSNGELNKLRCDLEKSKNILMGPYEEVNLRGGSSSTDCKLGEENDGGMEQHEICAALISLKRELNVSKMEVGGLQGLLAIAHREGREKVQRLEGETAVLRSELERERDRGGANNHEGYEKAQRLEGETAALRRELERERDRGGEQHDLVRTLQRGLELAQSKLATSNSRNAELRGELEAALLKLSKPGSYELQNQLEYIPSELASSKILCSKQQGELLSCRKEIDKLRHDVATLPILKQEVTSLQQDLENSKYEAVNLRGQLKAQTNAIEVAGDKNEVNALLQETLQLRKELEGLHNKLESQSVLQDRLEANVKEMLTLKSNLQAKSVKLEYYKKEISNLRVSSEAKTLELENSNKEVAALHKRLQLEHEQCA